MASPQIEEGYTKIANELLEALAKIRIPGEARQVLDVIIRKTYGFKKTADLISLSQFVFFTGLKRPNVVRAIKKLLEMNVINRDYQGYQKRYHSIKSDTGVSEAIPVTGGSYGLNKDYEKWVGSIRSDTPVSKAIMTLVSKAIHTKETITKEIILPVEKSPGRKSKDSAVKTTAQKINGWAIWVDINRERNRADPMPIGPDTKAAKLLAESIKDPQTIKDVMRLFLDDEDQFLQRNGYALRHIGGRVNAYVNMAEQMFAVPGDDEALRAIIEIENEVAAEEQLEREKQSRNIVGAAGAN